MVVVGRGGGSGGRVSSPALLITDSPEKSRIFLGSSDQSMERLPRACNNSVLFKYRIIDVSVKTEVCTSVRSDS